MQNIYKMGCYSARKHEILLFATTRVGLEGIVLSEISQWERQRPCDFTHVWTRRKPINKYMKTQNRWTNQTKKEHVDRPGRRRRKGERGKLVRCMVTDGKWSGGGKLPVGCAKLEIKCWRVEFVVWINVLLWFSCQVMSDSFGTPWTVAHQVPLSMGIPRQEYWSGLPFSSPMVFMTQGLNLFLLHFRWFLYHWATGEALSQCYIK